MLFSLAFENIALIERLHLEVSPGLTVVTGETGTGKSLIIDGLNLLMGQRADISLLREGCEQGMVTAQFQMPEQGPVRAWLAEQSLEGDGEGLFLRRSLHKNGRGRAFINDTPVPVTTLRQLGEMLVEIHGQHDHQTLLRPETHLDILDAFGQLRKEADAVRLAHGQWKKCQESLDTLDENAKSGAERREWLAFQLGELEQADFHPGEGAELEASRNRLAHATRLAENVQEYLALMVGDGGAEDGLTRVAAGLERDAETDATLAPLAESFRSLQYELSDANERLDHYLEGLEPDPLRLTQLEERLDLLHRLCRKHRRSADDLMVLAEKWREELDGLDTVEVRRPKLEKALKDARAAYEEIAARLSLGRQKAAKSLEKGVAAQLRDLLLADCRLSVSLTPVDGDPHPDGRERVQILVSANPGEPLKPLDKVASGGELSRLMLALKSVLADAVAVETLVFDEVDVGVGGRHAAGIGAKLHQVAHNRQVIAITHLPQVAAFGLHHWRVEKKSVAGRNVVAVQVADQEGRVEELARMLAGSRITDKARENARELLSTANAEK